jgi:hypothetical protein
MKKVSDKFDTLDAKLDHLEGKRGQLRQVPCRSSTSPFWFFKVVQTDLKQQTLSHEATTPLGRLNQVMPFASNSEEENV